MLQVGLRPENIMITHSESSAYRPPLSHSTTAPPEQWPRSSSSTSSATASVGSATSSATITPAAPALRDPATSTRGAPPSVFRQNTTATTVSSSSTSTAIPTPTHHASFERLQKNDPSPRTSAVHSHSTSSSSTSSDSSSTLVPGRARREEQSPILLRGLDHIVQLAKEDALLPASSRRSRGGYEDKRRYEISNMPVTDVIEMVAGLLTKITTTNDRQHDQLHRNIPPPDPSGTTNSVLAFHGKNVPSITINSYLSRIHKYCPTTYEVFLSLLVYFDRMTERVNKRNHQRSSSSTPGAAAEDSHASSSHVFVVDSYNIHRLVIAGVTCASKFFSDVFYTNSRYAKVGGLPLAELNHLELQFLILNDFRLSVPVEELEAYGTMLVQFYAREAIAKSNAPAPATAAGAASA